MSDTTRVHNFPSDSSSRLLAAARPVRDQVCSECGHEHSPCMETCRFYLGEGKFCECPSRRAA